MKLIHFKFLIAAAVGLALVVVLLGAYTRLTDAGLGCPDWPGCYGKLVLPQSATGLQQAQADFPNQPIEHTKAWTEMLHRYAAGSLAVIVFVLNGIALRRYFAHKSVPFSKALIGILVLIIIFQALLGMWTVTLKLLPIVVMSHLLGGILTFSCLCLLALQIYKVPRPVISIAFNKWQIAVALGLIIVWLQIALGGWVSANYAGTACLGFPECNGQWLPHLQFTNGFNLFSPIGQNYQGGLLDITARITIQFIHRIGAIVTVLYLFGLLIALAIKNHTSLTRLLAFAALGLVSVQFALGIINVVYVLPLLNAVAHNGVAALLSATMLMLCYITGIQHD